MAIYKKDRKRTKPWLAKRKRNGEVYLLGYFTTRKAAEAVEAEFDIEYPSGRGKYYEK